MNAIATISTNVANQSMLGNVVEDIHQLLHGLNWVKISCTKRSGNQVAHTLAHYARHVSEDMYWMEEVPTSAMAALYKDSILL